MNNSVWDTTPVGPLSDLEIRTLLVWTTGDEDTADQILANPMGTAEALAICDDSDLRTNPRLAAIFDNVKAALSK